MKNTRIQLTLFLDENESGSIEEIRQRFNPEQYGIIKSHITLCRENEIEELEIVLNNLAQLNTENFELEIGQLMRFSEGKGVMLPVKDDKNSFKNLRAMVLQNTNAQPRDYQAHITLMHPRNSTCDDLIFEQINAVEIPKKVTVSKISLIEQEIGKGWRLIKEFQLKPKN